MNNNLTDITMLVDRSGSMASCRIEAEGGINAFIEDVEP
jgi:Mg-chelatase subunit ChlD